jgi:poly(ADP-ribose) glycohydrolase ARH3
MLGLMVGDALGASCEGFPTEEIRKLAQDKWKSDFIQGYIPAVHMGTYVPAGQPGKYKPALEVNDQNFVPTGPPSNENVARECARYGMYTDDTNTCLALASSLAACGRIDAAHAAKSYAHFWRNGDAVRGYPPSAKQVMQATLDGVPAQATGLQPHFPFPGGSFANGGAMRISPLALAYRDAGPDVLRDAVAQAILSSHRHPEAIDFAVIQASLVQYALQVGAAGFQRDAVLDELASRCETKAMAGMVRATAEAIHKFNAGDDEIEIVKQLVGRERRPGSGFSFQIASVHMAPCVLWVACVHYRNPRNALQRAIDLGGDTDTTASMVGAILGAMHGEGWCEDWARELENGPKGKDYALRLAEELCQLQPCKH